LINIRLFYVYPNCQCRGRDTIHEVIDPATTIGAVHLSVADLARSLAFYERHLGMRVRARGDARNALVLAA